jgi:hypothetical protein
MASNFNGPWICVAWGEFRQHSGAVIRGWENAAWLVACGLLSACAGDKGESSTTTVTRSSGDPLLERYAGNFRYEKSEDGSQRVVSNARSRFEGKQADNVAAEYGTKEYRGTKAYTKKPWWGSKDYGTKSYEGPTDGSRFQKESALAGKGAPEAGAVAPAAGKSYRTGSYRTGAAREAGTRRLEHPQDALTENRRELGESPKIVGWEAQRKLQMGEVKGMLGKE